MFKDLASIIRFYKYAQYRKTNGFIAYHNENLDILEQLGRLSVVDIGVDNHRPFFIHHGQSSRWLDTEVVNWETGHILEITFEIKPSQICILNNRNDYESLFHFRHDHNGEYGIGHLSRKGRDVVDRGARWILLVDDHTGEDESFLIQANTLISKMVPVEKTFENPWER